MRMVKVVWNSEVDFSHWQPYPRGFGTPSVFLVFPTKQGIWHPHAKFPREFGISMQIFHSIQSYPRISITWNIYALHCSPSGGNCSRLTHLRWYQSPHVSYSTISSYISEQFNLHMGDIDLVTGASLIVCGKGVIVFLVVKDTIHKLERLCPFPENTFHCFCRSFGV